MEDASGQDGRDGDDGDVGPNGVYCRDGTGGYVVRDGHDGIQGAAGADGYFARDGMNGGGVYRGACWEMEMPCKRAASCGPHASTHAKVVTARFSKIQ